MIEYITATDFSQAQRLFHGRGHAYPSFEHINIDWFSPVVLITLYQEHPQSELEQIATSLMANIQACRSVQVQRRYLRFAPTEVLLGDELNETIVLESGLKYHISLGKAQNSGLFLDMKNGRDWLGQNAKGKNILNLFSYTCAFSVAAIAGGASKVVNVDMSKASLTKGRENHRLNQQNTKQVVFEGVDIFKSYGRLKKNGLYDILVCDPPSFQKGSVNIERDYGKILRRVPQLVKEGGELMLCLNSPDLNERFLHDEVSKAGLNVIFKTTITPPDVFKEAHQGKGLKVLVFTYLGSQPTTN